MNLFPSKIIGGCKSPEPLMRRWRILTTPWFSIKLHKFYRSDEDRELHDHPWMFISLILWGGYTEVTPPHDVRRMLSGIPVPLPNGWDALADIIRKRYLPGAILFRPAWWAHRVELKPGKVSYSLVIVFPKVRQWGFFTRRGWLDWKTFHGTAGCKDEIPEYQGEAMS